MLMDNKVDEIFRNLANELDQLGRQRHTKKDEDAYITQARLALLELIKSEMPSVEEILKVIEDNLECKDDDVIGCHINGRNASAQAIHTQTLHNLSKAFGGRKK